MKKKILIFTVLFLGVFCDLFAATPLSVHKNWTVFKTDDGTNLCYIVSLPVKKSGTYSKRGEPYFTLIRKKGTIDDEISASSGFLYDEDKDIELSLNKRKFPMFSDQEKAWTYDKNDDLEILKFMKLAKDMIVVGYSKGGSKAEDVYSLDGFTGAYNKMIELCK